MLETTITKLRKNLPKEIEPCFKNHETLHVKQRDGKDFVIISAEDWQIIEEKLSPIRTETIHNFDNELQANNIEQLPVKTKHKPEITKGDKNINPRDFFGLWSQQPRDIKEIRKQAWQRLEIES